MPGKIAFLTKRRPMGRDLLNDPYGRFYYLPLELAKLGYDVTVVALSYVAGETERSSEHGLSWESISLRPNPWSAYHALEHVVRAASPDWVVGCSDTYFGILAERLARNLGCRSVIDAYDNYCAYVPWASPLHLLWYRAITRCDLTTVAGPSLSEEWAQHCRGRRSVVIPMAPDPCGFFLRDRYRSRNAIGLPLDRPIVGYSGSISDERGIETLFDAFTHARQQCPELTLVLSGRLSDKVRLPSNTIYLGYLPNESVPDLINCFDVMAVINKDSRFGNYSYPVKLYEAMACKVPVIASRTKSTEWILSGFPELLVEPSNVAALSNAILAALTRGRIDYPQLPSWSSSAQLLDQSLIDLIEDAPTK